MSDLIDSLSRNLRGYWCPMLQYGGLTLRDQTRFKNNGTLTSMDVSTDWVMSRVRGRSGRALDFDGTNDYVANCGNTASFAFVHSTYVFTASIWFNLNSLSSRYSLFGTTNTGSELGFLMLHEFGAGLGTNSIRFVSFNGNLGQSKDLRSPNSVVVSGWNHAVVIGRGTAANSAMVINGQAVTTTASQDSANGTGNTTRNLSIGNDTRSAVLSNTLWTAGKIAEAAIWQRSISVGDAQALYRLGPGWYQPQLPRRLPYSEQQAGFRAYWARRQSQLIGGGV